MSSELTAEKARQYSKILCLLIKMALVLEPMEASVSICQWIEDLSNSCHILYRELIFIQKPGVMNQFLGMMNYCPRVAEYHDAWQTILAH